MADVSLDTFHRVYHLEVEMDKIHNFFDSPCRGSSRNIQQGLAVSRVHQKLEHVRFGRVKATCFNEIFILKARLISTMNLLCCIIKHTLGLLRGFLALLLDFICIDLKRYQSTRLEHFLFKPLIFIRKIFAEYSKFSVDNVLCNSDVAFHLQTLSRLQPSVICKRQACLVTSNCVDHNWML